MKVVNVKEFEKVYATSCGVYGGCDNIICKNNPCEAVNIVRTIAFELNDNDERNIPNNEKDE